MSHRIPKTYPGRRPLLVSRMRRRRRYPMPSMNTLKEITIKGTSIESGGFKAYLAKVSTTVPPRFKASALSTHRSWEKNPQAMKKLSIPYPTACQGIVLWKCQAPTICRRVRTPSAR